MFRDMGEVDEAAAERIRQATQRYMESALASGEYIGWLAADDTGRIVGGAGVQLRPILPRPIDNGGVTLGPEALVLNVYTEHGWRRRGVARLVMSEVLAWARRENIVRLVLHASPEGRALYESLGFLASNEMRLPLAYSVSR